MSWCHHLFTAGGGVASSKTLSMIA